MNFNLHGEMVPSSVCVVSTDPFVEVARIETCTMPHGSRLNAAGTKHYSACMMDDMLVEIDTRELAVSRGTSCSRREASTAWPGAPRDARHDGGAASGATAGTAWKRPKPGDVTCSPTWAQPSADGKQRVRRLQQGERHRRDRRRRRGRMTRRIPAGDGVYNLAVTRDGTLLVGTNKRGQSVSVIDIATGKELARIPTLRRVVHGVAISPDDRYAFISVEGVGSEPGTVEMIDLRTMQRVASADVGQMAGGIDVLK